MDFLIKRQIYVGTYAYAQWMSEQILTKSHLNYKVSKVSYGIFGSPSINTARVLTKFFSSTKLALSGKTQC